MSKNLGSCVALTSGVIACLVLSLSIQVIAAPPALISDSGQKLSSVFEGLKSNPRLVNYHPSRRPWRPVLQSRLPGLLNVGIVYGSDFCPTSSCSGGYNNFQEQPGGCDATGCPDVEDAYTDLSQPCYYGVRDSECGDGTGVCCANAVECDNYLYCSGSGN